MAALGGLSPRMRARVQKIVLKVKLSFSETSQVPGAAGDTVRIFLLICQKDKEKTNKQTKKRLLLSTGSAAPGWLGGELAWALGPEMGDSAQRPRLSRLPWPLGSSLKLKCDRCHFDSRQVSGSRRLWQGLQRARSGLLQEAGQAQPPWVPRAHSSIPVSSALLYPSPAPQGHHPALRQPCLLLQNLLLTLVFPTLQPKTPCPAPPTSVPLFCWLLTS